MLKNKGFVVSLTAIFIAGAVGLYALGSHELSVVCVMCALFVAMAGIGNQNEKPAQPPTEVRYYNQVAPDRALMRQEVADAIDYQVKSAMRSYNNYRGR